MFLSQIWFAISKYDKYCFRKSCKGIKISSCCYIQLLTVKVTVQQSFSAIISPVTTVNDHLPTVVLSTESSSFNQYYEKKTQNCFFKIVRFVYQSQYQQILKLFQTFSYNFSLLFSYQFLIFHYNFLNKNFIHILLASLLFCFF